MKVSTSSDGSAGSSAQAQDDDDDDDDDAESIDKLDCLAADGVEAPDDDDESTDSSSADGADAPVDDLGAVRSTTGESSFSCLVLSRSFHLITSHLSFIHPFFPICAFSSSGGLRSILTLHGNQGGVLWK